MLRVKAFNHSQDYQTLCTWWPHWGHTIAPADELSPTGFMVYQDDKPILCGFLILTNAKFAYIETLCAAPTTTWKEREEAIVDLIKVASKVAKDLGYRRLLALPQKEYLMEKAKAAGFLVDKDKTFICVKEI